MFLYRTTDHGLSSNMSIQIADPIQELEKFAQLLSLLHVFMHQFARSTSVTTVDLCVHGGVRGMRDEFGRSRVTGVDGVQCWPRVAPVHSSSSMVCDWPKGENGSVQ